MKPSSDKIGFVSQKVYKNQSQWYDYVRQRYGLPLDSRHLYSKSDWEFFAMAVTSNPVRHKILQSVALWINETNTDRPLTDLYDTEGQGGFPGPNFFARPVVGGHFAQLALQKACGGKAIDGLSFLNENASEDDDVFQCEGRDCYEDYYEDKKEFWDNDDTDEEYSEGDESEDEYSYHDDYTEDDPQDTHVRVMVNLPKAGDVWADDLNE